MFKKSSNEVQPMTLEVASDYARQLVELEARGRGDTEGALFRLEQRYGLGPNQVMHLASGRAKSCDVSLFARLRLAYLDLCAAHVRKLQLKIATEEAQGDVSNSDLADRLRAIATEIETKKAGLK